MGDEINFVGENATYWENIDEATIKGETSGLIKRINNVVTLLDKMVYQNDYDKTAKAYDSLWMDDLSAAGWVPSFKNANADTLSPYAGNASRPTWYQTSAPEAQKAFDAACQCYTDYSHLAGSFEALRKIMMLFPLRDTFRFQRLTLNFDEAGFSSDVYHEINDDVSEVAQLLRKSWETLEREALRSERFYQEKGGKVSRDEMKAGYRAARIADYQLFVDASRAHDSFIARSDGSFVVDPNRLIEAKVIDKYTEQIAGLDNIEDDMKKTIEGCGAILASINEYYGEIKASSSLEVIDALRRLVKAVSEFAEIGLHVYTQYKDRDTDSPYCFVRKLPALSEMNGAYGFEPLTADPWHDGTQFEKLYQSAARALTAHCSDFVNKHGHTEVLM